MKLLQRDDGFSPIAIVLENRDDLNVFWGMMLHIQNHNLNRAELEMALEISNWISNEAHL